MAANASRVRKMYDGDASVVFRAAGSASVSADGYSTALSLNELDAAYWQTDGEIPEGYLVVGVLVEALNLAAAGPLPIAVRVDDTNNMSDTPKEAARISVSATGYYEIVVAAKDIPKFDSESSGADKWAAIFIDVDVSQTISYHAWIASSRTMGL